MLLLVRRAREGQRVEQKKDRCAIKLSCGGPIPSLYEVAAPPPFVRVEGRGIRKGEYVLFVGKGPYKRRKTTFFREGGGISSPSRRGIREETTLIRKGKLAPGLHWYDYGDKQETGEKRKRQVMECVIGRKGAREYAPESIPERGDLSPQ